MSEQPVARAHRHGVVEGRDAVVLGGDLGRSGGLTQAVCIESALASGGQALPTAEERVISVLRCDLAGIIDRRRYP